jgi:hypothetical protein
MNESAFDGIDEISFSCVNTKFHSLFPIINQLKLDFLVFMGKNSPLKYNKGKKCLFGIWLVDGPWTANKLLKFIEYAINIT